MKHTLSSANAKDCKMSISHSKHRLSLSPLLTLLFVFAPAQQSLAAPVSFASVGLSSPNVNSASDSQLNSATPATAALPGIATGHAKSIVGIGSVGVGINVLAGAPIGGSYSADAYWQNSWIASAPTTVGAMLTLHGSISNSLIDGSGNPVGPYDGFFQFAFDYAINGINYLHFAAFADSGFIKYEAFSNGTDISSSVFWTANIVNPLVADFDLAFSPTFTTTGAFLERMDGSILVDGGGAITLDAFHTFHAELASLNPNVTLTDEAGRSVGFAVPEPKTYSMMLAGLGVLGFAARRRRVK